MQVVLERKLKIAVIIAGPNGAGKTTFYQRHVGPKYPSVPFVNADWIEREMQAQGQATSPYEAADEAERRRRQLIREGASFVTETVFSHPSKLELVRDLIVAGYQVTLHVIHLNSADVAIERVKYRVASGGHNVPEDKIRSRFPRTKSLTRDAEKLASRVFVWDNSDPVNPFRKVP